MSKSRTNLIKIYLRFIITIILLIIIVSNIDYHVVLNIFSSLDTYWLGVSLLITFSIRLLTALRWKILLASLNIQVKLSELVMTIFVGNSVGYIIPGGIGTDIYRGHSISKKHGNLPQVSATILLDRIIGVFSMLLLALMASVFLELLETEVTKVKTDFVNAMLLINVAFIIFLVFLFSSGLYFQSKSLHHIFSKRIKSLKNWIDQLIIAIKNIVNFKKAISMLLLISLIVQIARCIMFLCIFNSIGTSLNVFYCFVFIPIVFVAMMIPLSIGGLGVREGSLIYLFSTIKIPSESSMMTGLIFQFLQIIALLPGLFIFLLHKDFR